MNPIVPTRNIIDITDIDKWHEAQKIQKLITVVDESCNNKMVKHASSVPNGTDSAEALIGLFAKMLECLKLRSSSEDDVKTLITALLEKPADMTKNASLIKKTRSDEIKIVSRRQKDSHYQVDVSKDLITDNGRKIFMVSCYARDAYLGRYLIKRNYFYTEPREKSANEAYDEIITKMSALKDRYYSEVIGVQSISTQLKAILDGVISELQSDDDTLATNIKR